MASASRTLAVVVLGTLLAGAPAAAAAQHHSHHTTARVHHRSRPAPSVESLAGGARYPRPLPAHPTASALDTGGVIAPSGSTGAIGATGAGSTARSGGTTGGTQAPAAGATATSGSAGATGASGTTGASGVTGASGATGSNGGGSTGPTVPGWEAEILPGGQAIPPADAPAAVRAAIVAGNELIGKPYVYGGGHRSFVSAGYDCSGAVSFALHGGDLLSAPLDSTDFQSWGLAGAGQWITVYTNPTHAYMQIAGIRLDTSTEGDPGGQQGPRWRPVLTSHAGFQARHPAGL